MEVYRRCLWCREYFWAHSLKTKCCCPEHQEARTADQNKRSRCRQMAKKKKAAMALAAKEAKGKA